jgi:MFS family permease
MVIHKTRWSEKHRMFMMITGWLIWAVGIGSYLLVSTPGMLFVTQILLALGNAIANPAFDAELAEHVDKKLRNFEWGIYEGSQDVFAGIAAILGGFVATYFGFFALICCMAVSATISTGLIVYYAQIMKKRVV